MTSEEDIVRTLGTCTEVALPDSGYSQESGICEADDGRYSAGADDDSSTRFAAGVDLRRVVVVADRLQSSLAWQCTFGGPSTIRGIALTDGWFSSSEIQGVEGAGHSVLLLDSTQGAQAKALRELSRKSLTDAGFWAPLPTASDETDASDNAAENRGVRCIADWSLLMRSF